MMRLLPLYLCLLATPALAQEDITRGAEVAGRAGTGVALPQADAAVYVNPAGASLTPNLVAGLLYQFLPGQGSVLSALAVDGTAPYVDGGVGATVLLSKDLTLA